ncbi:hypothetical protein [Brevibacillus laterosporus]|uniref:hypothetical protein n=1 Tax=Brevibacillus laterosporus TaxID=1465 RepID=UPI003D21A5BD
MKKSGLIPLLMASLVLIVSPNVFAKENDLSQQDLTKQRIFHDRQLFIKAIEEYEKKTKTFSTSSYEQDLERIKSLQKEAAHYRAKTGNYEDYANYILSHTDDVIVLMEHDEASLKARSVRDDIKITKPDVFYYKSSGRTSVNGYYKWITENYFDDRDSVGSVGGEDAVSLNFDNIDSRAKSGILSWALYTFNKNGDNSYVSYNPEATESNGSAWSVVFQGQDRIEKNSDKQLDYSWQNGNIEVIFDKNFYYLSGSVNTTYAHTWDSTDITGFTVDKDGGISFTFSKVSNKFQVNGKYASY